MLISSTTDTQEIVDALNAPPATEGTEETATTEEQDTSAAADEDSAESSSAAESDGDSESTEGDQEESEETEAPKRGFKKRIDKLSRRIGERDGRIAFLEKQLAEQNGGEKAAGETAAAAAPAAQAAAIDPAKPVLANFETYEDYTEALTDWKLEQRDRVKQEQAAAKQQADTWTGRITAAKERIPDFMDVVSKASDVPISEAMDQLIRGSEQGPDLVYHLVKHPAEAKRIAALNPLAAAHAMGKLEASLGTTPKPESIKTSAAPAPINPVGVRSTKTAKDPAAMSMKEYNAWRDGGGGR